MTPKKKTSKKLKKSKKVPVAKAPMCSENVVLGAYDDDDSFVGRDPQMETIDEQLDRSSLVDLFGRSEDIF